MIAHALYLLPVIIIFFPVVFYRYALMTHSPKVINHLTCVYIFCCCTDTTFANTTGRISNLNHPTWVKPTEPFAVAESCESGRDPGYANIDLTGTDFVLNTTFVSGGASPSGNTKFSGQQQAIVQGDGYCGHRSPSGWTQWPATSRLPGHPQYVLKLALRPPTLSPSSTEE